MSRRSIIVALVLAIVGTTVGVAVAAFRPRNTDVVLDASPIAPAAAPLDDVARIDPLPGLGPIEVPSTGPAKSGTPVDVAAVQRRLAELKYYGGPINGSAGGATRSAVMAFQKVQGLGADGSIGPATLAALTNPTMPVLRGGPSKRVEVDLGKQVLYYVEGGAIARIMPISSGNGATYRQKDGTDARSLTPVGTFRIQRVIGGVREADLGTLYDPMYFYQGWAIHGSNSVPAYPASHGCVRVTRADALWLFGRLPVGSTIVIYGGSHTFVPGSGAPGTDTPAGDRAGEIPAIPLPDGDDESPATPAPKPPKPAPEPDPAPEESEDPPDERDETQEVVAGEDGGE
jgi:lipoprotein-anchoring transpeptidase ErfK/SrfK